MRRALLIILLLSLAAPASAMAEAQGIRGKIINTSCFGPCSPETPPRVWKGEAEVRVKTLPEREFVARLTPQGGRFGAVLTPGRYVVKLDPEDDVQWASDSDRVRVRDDRFKPLTLYTHNVFAQG